jgi:hypothetical protein
MRANRSAHVVFGHCPVGPMTGDPSEVDSVLCG